MADFYSAIHSTQEDDVKFWDGTTEWGYVYSDGGLSADYRTPAGNADEAARDALYGADYSTLAAWEDARDREGNTDSEHAIIMGPWSVKDTADFHIDDGWDTDDMVIRAIGVSRVNGIWDTTDAYMLSVDMNDIGDKAIDINYACVIDGIQFEDVSGGANTNALLRIGYTGTGHVINCMFKLATDIASAGIDSDAAGTFNVWNCIIYADDTAGFSGTEGIHAVSGSTFNVYNTTIYCMDDGMEDSGSTLNVDSCAIFNCTDDIENADSINTCATDQGGGEGVGGVDISGGGGSDGDWETTEFVDPTTPFNFNVQDAAAAIKGTGTDNSGVFTNDIAGNTRTTWDIGAFEFEAIVGGNAGIMTTWGGFWGPTY